MTPSPSLLVFDVNETLSDMSPMADRFVDLGAPRHLAALWFASVLRDGFALTAAGAQRTFAELGEAALRTVLHGIDLTRDPNAAIDHVMGGFAQLSVHPDVSDGVRALRRAGHRLVTLSNGSTQVAERLLTEAGIRAEFEAVLSVEQAGAWKPARLAYEYAAHTCRSDVADMMLVAVHPWDIDGAARAGLRTAWIARDVISYPDVFSPPSLTATGLSDLAVQLADH